MNKHLALWSLAVAVLLMAVPALAQTWVPVGTAEGGIAVYFNDTNEVPTNVSYIRVQYANSTTNVNGASISMLEPFKTIFGDLGQYGFDGIALAPTNTNPHALQRGAVADWNVASSSEGVIKKRRDSGMAHSPAHSLPGCVVYSLWQDMLS